MIEFTQSKPFRGNLNIQLSDEGDICVTRSSLTTKSIKHIRASELQQRPSYYQSKSLPSIIVIVTSLFLVANLGETLMEGTGGPLMVLLMTFFLAIGSYTTYRLIKNRGDLVVYRFQNRGEVAFTLWNNKPDRDQFEDSTSKLSDAIGHYQLQESMANDEKLENYGRYLRFLVDENVIEDDLAVELFGKAEKRFEG